jgi:hypothetical protein
MLVAKPRMNTAEDLRHRHEPTSARQASPDPILASGGYVAARCQPEKRLMVAILEGAVSDLQHHATASSGRGRRIFMEVDAWFASTACDGLGDFEYICAALDFDPSFIRAGLRRWCAARRGGDSIGPPPALRLAPGPGNLASRPRDSRGSGQPAREWWVRGFACMPSADAYPTPGDDELRSAGDGGR